jgi:hypothetical protein
MKLRTPFVFASKDQADSVLTGELTAFNLRTQAETTTKDVVVTRVTATVKFRWYDRLTGANIVPEQTVEEAVRISPEMEDNEHNLAFQEMAKRIVIQMQQPW